MVKTAGTALAVVAAALAIPAGASPGETVLERARRAAEEASFLGVVEVTWREDGVTQSERLTVHAAGGRMVVRGGNALMASAERERLVQHQEGGWTLLWPRRLTSGERPEIEAKYDDTPPSPGPLVAGRPTEVVEMWHEGRLRERVYLDAGTGLLLRREQYGEAPVPERVVGFESVSVTRSTPPPHPPVTIANRSPRWVPATKLPSGLHVPAALSDGYRRVGLYRRGDIVHALYSDGLYDLSVFEQPGRLDRGRIPPSSAPVGVKGVKGWRYAWPGGHVLLWEAGGVVYTAVGGAPLGEVVEAVASIPVPRSSRPSLIGKLRGACRAMVAPLE